jgi:2-polyprenyl-3-methyl-5-hydroxy-6-metoxy-1,4-benzoquinol methylase
MNKFGKTSDSLILLKESFFNKNTLHAERHKKISTIYLQQPKRINCKNCDTKLSQEPDFVKLDIPYELCVTCNHLNGLHEDTFEFCQSIYEDEAGEKEYSSNYSASGIEEFNFRTTSIYIPKAEFLYSSLLKEGVNPNNLSYMDFGAGSGYFINALDKIGIANLKGYEPSRSQVTFGNQMLGKELLINHEIAETNEILNNATENVLSLIGVLEHVQKPRELLKCFQGNENLQYLYFSVPTFSLSTYLEIINPEVFHRQLQGGHTHLYTKESIEHLAKEFAVEIISQWWFGTDVVDLFRHMKIKLNDRHISKRMEDMFDQTFISYLDSMQLEIDKKYGSSEVHVLCSKK